MRAAAAILTAGAIVRSVVSFAQETPRLTYRTGIDMVQVDVSVLDRDRHPVTGLKPGDFVLREDGKVKAIAAFSTVTLPGRPPEPVAPWIREVGPDVVTNLMPKEGRLVVILLDYSILKSDIPWARRTAEAAVDQLGPGDMAAVIYTSVGVPQNFTADRSLLRAAIDRPFLGINLDPDDPFGAHRGECRCGVCSLEVMTNVADAVREVPQRRKMLLFIGSDVSVSTTGIECFAEVREAREKLLRAAGAANLTIHTFDSTLLESLGYSASQSAAPSATDSRVGHLVRQNNLAFFPGETGGRAIKNTNAPWESIPAIFSETDSYYVLGFVPTSRRGDPYHDISVEVNLPGVQVHPRKGYYAPSAPAPDSTTPSTGGPPASLTAALSNLWPKTQLPMSVTAAAFATPGKPGAAVAVVARAQEPVAGEPGSAIVTDRPAQVHVLAGAYGREGEPLATQVQTIRVRPSAAGQKVFQYEVVSRLQLKSGRHEIRVAAEDPDRHLTGSVYTYVDVPDFAKAPVSLSGVVLGTRPSEPGSAFHDLFPLAPTARRQFATTDHVTAFVRVYQAENDSAVPIAITTRIVDALNRTAYEARTALFDADRVPTRSADFRFDLPLAPLSTGQYVLSIEATRRAKQTARHDVVFSVR
jgi:VWFA-related protein